MSRVVGATTEAGDAMSGNELHRAASPYLLQHKDNPVHWREWGPDALALARATDKPILLSVGYAACHWCHVMASESFEDPETAEVMNALFVNIKVDREERPDVDHLYMSALHALGQQGGWPLTMFLAPDAAPFWGGTYFPKQARFGRPCFVDVLRSAAAAFRDRHPAVATNKAALMGAVRARTEPDGSGPGLSVPALDAIAGRAAAAVDPVNGGLGDAPKFPNASLLELLLRGGARRRDAVMTDLAILTLRRICLGGIRDHLGGGFARYSVDARWLVPHFEKMLYDNAQSIELLALAFHQTRDPLFKDCIHETVGWLEREMTAGGAFCASLDADSEHVEGKFYVWTRPEIAAVLGTEDAALFCRVYDVSDAGNWQDEHTGQSVAILNRLDTPAPTPDEEARLVPMRAVLMAARSRRVPPARDDKILTDWNGLAIAALARAASLCDEPAWFSLAGRTFDAVVTLMGDGPGGAGGLVHARLGTRRGGQAFASDYAAMAGAALALYEGGLGRPEAAARPQTLGLARRWLDILAARYAGPDGVLFMTPAEGSDIPARLAPLADEATPNANGVYAAALLRFAAVTGDEGRRETADRLFEAAAPVLLRYPLGHCAILNAFDLRMSGVDIVLAGPDTAALAEAALRVPYLNRTLARAEDLPSSHVARHRERVAGRGAAFVCRGGACSAPVHDPRRLAERIASPGEAVL